jgi:hypothetical protein
VKVHLVRALEYDKEDFRNVVQFLTSFDGPITFIPNEPLEEEDDVEAIIEKVDKRRFYKQYALEERCSSIVRIPRSRKVATWNNMFEYCYKYRSTKKVLGDEIVILLTPYANEHNWFSAADSRNRLNGFVQTSEWSHYVSCASEFPVAYLIASLILQMHMFDSMNDLLKQVHHQNLGCFNDFCANKKDVLLKLRTADICYDCMSNLKDKVSIVVTRQVLDIFEGVRRRTLLVQNFQSHLLPSKLLVKQNRLFLADYGNLEIKLTPLEKTLYLFFLRHPEGVMLKHLVDHRDELRTIYGQLSNTGILAEINTRIMTLADARTNSASEKLSKIKQKFIEAVGENIASQYYVQGEDGSPKSIPLPASRLVFA